MGISEIGCFDETVGFSTLFQKIIALIIKDKEPWIGNIEMVQFLNHSFLDIGYLCDGQ
jgi:hypothetical protein